MAGNYPDALAPRIPYDTDGTVGFVVAPVTGDVTILSNGVLVAWNNEANDIGSIGAGSGLHRYGFLFPEPMNVVGIFTAAESFTIPEISVDTTNGFDGTWVAQSTIPGQSNIGPNYRTNVTEVSWLGIRGLRAQRNNPYHNWYARAIHLYGYPSEEGTRLSIWHPTLDEEVDGAYFDWDDIRQGSSSDRQFRIKNSSPTMIAHDITISVEAPTDGSPSIAGQHLLANDGSSFGATTSITGPLVPGAISDPITMRRATPSNAALGLWVARVRASADSWTA